MVVLPMWPAMLLIVGRGRTAASRNTVHITATRDFAAFPLSELPVAILSQLATGAEGSFQAAWGGAVSGTFLFTLPPLLRYTSLHLETY